MEADSVEQAESKAIEFITDDQDLKNSLIDKEDNCTVIFVEEIRLFEKNEDQLMNSGYTFYSENDEISR